MEHWRELFHAALNDEGSVEISGHTFQRDQILRELEKLGYDQAFDDWALERKQEFLQRAYAILSLHDNANRFSAVKRCLSADTLVPVIGAGMTRSCGFPLWTEFLRNLQKESHVPIEDLNTAIESGDYEGAAQLLYDDLGSNLFNSQLEETFKPIKEICGPINYLFELFPKSSVITTNFDPSIETLADSSPPNRFSKVQTAPLLQEALRLKASGARLLLKIHGECDIVQGRVLTKSEYDLAYSDTGIVNAFVERILFSQPLLFLGCSLNYDRLIKRMKEFVAGNDASTLPRHYALLELKDGDDRVARKKHLAEANIFPIWYPEGEHEESIEALFLKLLEDE